MFAILILAALWSYVGHQLSVPAELQYVPRDDKMLVATGPIESVWHSIDDHFGSVIHSTTDNSPFDTETGFAKQQIDKLQDWLRKQHIPVSHLRDLTGYGIDIRRGLFISFYRVDGPFLAVVPTADQSAFKEAMKRLLSGYKMEEVKIPGVNATTVTFQFDDTNPDFENPVRHTTYVAFPERNIALISDNRELIARSLRDPSANLAYARQNDDLLDALRQCLGRPMATGPTIFAFARPDDVPGLLHAGIGMEFRHDDVLLKAQFGVTRNVLKLVSDLLADPPPDAAWPSRLPSRAGVALAIQDKALGGLIGTLGATFTDLRDVLKSIYGGFLWMLQGSPGVSRIVIALTGYRDGLPELLMGIWGNKEQIESKLQELRLTFRRERDIGILTAAREAVADPARRTTSAILPEPFSTFARYTLGPNETFEGTPTPEDFQNETYVVRVDGRAIHYVAPRLTNNDKRFRKEFEKLSEAELSDTDTLDRYRIAYVSDGAATWIATNVGDLKAVLTRPGDNLAGSLYFKSSTRNSTARDKVQIFLNVDQIVKFGLLSPEIENVAKDCLLDLREHPAITADLHRCTLRRDCFSASVRLVRRTAIR
jgi:hypothetical protein